MPLILHIETSENICSVALSQGRKLIAERESEGERSHASLVTVLIQEVLEMGRKELSQLQAVSVSKGPGSYTGLRIGVSAAKGLCFGLNIPLIAVNTLEALCYGANQKAFLNRLKLDPLLGTLFCPMLDARRMEVYRAFFNSNFEYEIDTAAEIVEENIYQEILDNQQVIFFGSGSGKIRNLINHKNAFFISEVYPKAKYLIPFASRAFENQQFENAAYFEPFYLKDFVATTSKKNVLSS